MGKTKRSVGYRLLVEALQELGIEDVQLAEHIAGEMESGDTFRTRAIVDTLEKLARSTKLLSRLANKRKNELRGSASTPAYVTPAQPPQRSITGLELTEVEKERVLSHFKIPNPEGYSGAKLGFTGTGILVYPIGQMKVQSTIKVFGQESAPKRVTVYYDGIDTSAQADENGFWSAEISFLNTGTQKVIVRTGGQTLGLEFTIDVVGHKK